MESGVSLRKYNSERARAHLWKTKKDNERVDEKCHVFSVNEKIYHILPGSRIRLGDVVGRLSSGSGLKSPICLTC